MSFHECLLLMRLIRNIVTALEDLKQDDRLPHHAVVIRSQDAKQIFSLTHDMCSISRSIFVVVMWG